MSEVLYKCSQCQRENFTSKGYAAHRCQALPKGQKPSLNDRLEMVGEAPQEEPVVNLPVDREVSFLGDVDEDQIDSMSNPVPSPVADFEDGGKEIEPVKEFQKLRCDTHLTLPCRYEQTIEIDLGRFDGGYQIVIWVVESKGEEQATDRYYFGWSVCNYSLEPVRAEYYSPSFAWADAQSVMWAQTVEDVLRIYIDEVFAMVPEGIHDEVDPRLNQYIKAAIHLGSYPKMNAKGWADPDFHRYDLIIHRTRAEYNARYDSDGNPLPESRLPLGAGGMSPALAVKLPVAVAGSWEGARRWRDAARKLEEGKLFAQVMLGFELLTLKSLHSQQGKRSDLASGGTRTWKELLENELGLSEETTRRLTLMAEAAKPKLKKLPALASFDPSTTSVSALPADVQEALSGVVRKITDGQTQTEFMEELGLVKSRGNKGGRGKGSGGSKSLSLAEQSELMTELARKDWRELEKGLLADYQDKFLLLPDPEIEGQIGALEKALAARRAWLRQRPELRTQDFTKSISAALQ